MTLAGALPRLTNQDLALIRVESEERLLRHRGSGSDCQSCALHRQLASMAQELEARRAEAIRSDPTEPWHPSVPPKVGDVMTADALAACPWVIEYEVLEDHYVQQDSHRMRVVDRVKVLGVKGWSDEYPD